MKRLGKFVAQGAAGNAIVGYVIVVSAVLYNPNGYNFFYLAGLPFYLAMMGIIGTGLGGVIWIWEWLLERRLRILERAAVGIISTTLVMAVLSLWLGFIKGFILEWRLLGGSLLSGLVLGLPVALMTGSRFHPLRSIVFGLYGSTSFRDFGSLFAFLPGLLLRVGSLFGLLESFLFLTCLASMTWVGLGLDHGGELLAATMVAILYFAASAFVSFGSPPKWLLLTITAVANLPLAIWAWATYPFTTFSIAISVFLSLWLLLIVGRMLSSDNNPKPPGRIFPLTMLEIEIRHALKRW